VLTNLSTLSTHRVIVRVVARIVSVAVLSVVASLQTAGVTIGDESPTRIRIACFNIEELSLTKFGRRESDETGKNTQLRNAAEIIRRIRPDVLLLNEIDYVGPEFVSPAHMQDGDNTVMRFQVEYLSQAGGSTEPIEFKYVFFAPTNTGVPTGKDLDNDGDPNGPGDAYGYGKYPGQYGMALLSRFPIDFDNARTFQKLLWKEMPGNLMPDGNDGKPGFYSEDEIEIFRLSSKSHWDVPIRIGDKTLHALCSHPTPPVFDGPEDWNGRRNFDEIRLFADYITGGEAAAYIKDDSGKAGGLDATASFVILGDQNSDPVRGDKPYGPMAIQLLLTHSRVQDPKPTSTGAASSSNPRNLSDFLPYKTSEFGRLDYALPSKNLKVTGSGVFWPAAGEDGAELVATRQSSSDHRMVWVDLDIAAAP
jgi:endonuclease/exonuclease/phosphatase family metal-dependent hydrolase